MTIINIYLVVSYATCMLTCENDKIIAACPIMKWTLGKSKETVKKYFQRKKQLITWEEYPE